MTFAIDTSYDFTPFEQRRVFERRRRPPSIAGRLALGLGLLFGTMLFDTRQTAATRFDEAAVRAPQAAAMAPAPKPAPDPNLALLDPSLLDFSPTTLAQISPLASAGFQPRTAPQQVAMVDPDVVVPVPVPQADVAELVDSVPLPAPRPVEFNQATGQGPLHVPARPAVRANRVAAFPVAPPDNRSFIEKLFGMPQRPGPVMAYATPEDGVMGMSRRLTSGPSTASYGRSTAVYDIEAHTVTLPNGMRLEAHSGLGDRLDDPRFVHERMRGPTPPAVYELTPREQLFHGVQALRLNPVGGGGIYGRTGLLAHTYMLGPNGDSNGCVSFKDYNAFLQAYMNGDVKRLVVVARQS